MYRVRTSISNEHQAALIAREIVQSKAAVAVHIRPIRSIYAWEDNMCDEQEFEMESITSCPDEVDRLIRGMHPYDCPEIIQDVIHPSKEIEDWITGWCKYNKDLN